MSKGNRSLIIDAALLTLCASARVVIERLQDLEHGASDLVALFVPNLSWWWSAPRWLGGWNPWIFAGFPANADPLIGQLHPLGLLYALTPPFTAAALDGILSPSFAAVGMLVYLHVIGCGRAGRLVGALSFGLGGFVASHAPHPPLLHAALAIPWALAAIEALDGPRLVAGLAATTAAILVSGHPQVVAYALTVVVTYAAWLGRPTTGRRAAALAGGMLLGAGVAAGTWLPALQLIQSSTHALGGEASPAVVSVVADPDRLSFIHLLGLLVPFASGGATGALYGSLPQPEGCGIIECTGYPGMIVWLAVLAGVPRVLRDRHAGFWLVAALLGLFLSTGVAGGWPPGGAVRSPARLLLWWNLAAAAMAGLVLGQARSREPDRPRGRGPTRRLCWVAVGVSAALIVWAGVSGTVPYRTVAVSAGALTAAALAISVHHAGGWLLVVVAAADLIAFGASMPFGIPSPQSSKEIQILDKIREVTERESDVDGRPGRSAVLPFSWKANWAPFRDAHLIQGYNVLVPKTLARLLGYDPSSRRIELGWIGDPALAAPSSHVLDLLRCRVLATLGGPADPLGNAIRAAAASGSARWERIGQFSAPPLEVFVNNRALPVAWLVQNVQVVSPEEALQLVRGVATGTTFDPGEVALATMPIPGVHQVAGTQHDSTSGSLSPVVVLDYGEDSIRLAAEPTEDALLVSSELAYPGWTATVDGRWTTVHTVNAGFRAVVVPAGRREVVFAYAPGIARLGLTVSAATLLVLLCCLFTGPNAASAPGVRGNVGAQRARRHA